MRRGVVFMTSNAASLLQANAAGRKDDDDSAALMKKADRVFFVRLGPMIATTATLKISSFRPLKLFFDTTDSILCSILMDVVC